MTEGKDLTPHRIREADRNIRTAVLAPSLAERTGLQTILSAGNCILPVAQGSQLEDILAWIEDIDVLVVMVPDIDTIDNQTAGMLQTIPTGCGILWISNSPDPFVRAAAQSQRAWGILSKEFSEEELLAAVTAVAEGLIVLTSQVVSRFSASERSIPEWTSPEKPNLSTREMQVLELLSQGLANKQIAEKLKVRPNTVKYYVASIYQKIGANNRAEAVTRAIQAGLLSV